MCVVYRKLSFPGGSVVKNLPVMQETWVPLEKEMATHFNIFAWEIPWTERSLAGHSPQRSQKSQA